MAASPNRVVRDLWQAASPLPEMDDEQFRRWVALVEERTGMALPPERKSFLVTSVGLRMRELGFTDFDAYYHYLTTGVAGRLEWTALVDRLTVHETRFYRNPEVLRFLIEAVLPDRRNAGVRDLNLWSVGCSTGEEAYSLAMEVDRWLDGRAGQMRFGVTGTDISLHSLSAARRAVYPQRQLMDLPAEMQNRYCEASAEPGSFRVAARLRDRMCFAHMNVLDAAGTPSRHMDVICCQNLLIYFDRKRRQQIVDALATHLRPGGYMLLGAGELLGATPRGLVRVGAPETVLAFRRSGATEKEG